jgi:hypothetical protein
MGPEASTATLSWLPTTYTWSKRFPGLHSLPVSPKLSGAAPPNRARRATIAFLESDRPDAPRAGDAYGDVRIARGAAPDASFRIPTSGRLSWSARASTTLRPAPQPLIVADSL